MEVQIPLKNIPRYHAYVKHPIYQGEPYALGMHGEKFKKLGSPRDYPDDNFESVDWLTKEFAEFLITNGFTKDRGGRIAFYAGGKNFGAFDLQFLKKLPYWDKHFNCSSMIMDPGPMYTLPKDKKMPSMEECAKRAGIDKDFQVTHDAMNEVLMVIELIRKKLIENY